MSKNHDKSTIIVKVAYLQIYVVFHNIVVLRKSLTGGNWCIIFYSETFAELLYWMYDCDVKKTPFNKLASLFMVIP